MLTSTLHTSLSTLSAADIVNRIRLGKGPHIPDHRRFALADFIPLGTPPPSANFYQGQTQFGMMLNDVLGDCTCAAVGHAEQVASLNDAPPPEIGTEITVTDDVIENMYEKSCGYVPGNPFTDNGGIITNVLDWARQHGIGHPGPTHHHRHRLVAYADPNPANVTHIKQAIAEFMIVDIGLQLPVTAQAQIGGVWDVVGNPRTDPDSVPGSWGGHSVVVAEYDVNGLTCITWGALQAMTWRFWNTYCDEAHVLFMAALLDRYKMLTAAQLAILNAQLQALNN